MKNHRNIQTRADYVRDTACSLVKQLNELQNLREKVLRAEAREKLRRKRPWAETATGAEGSAWKERELISGPSAQSINGIGGIDIDGHQSPAHGFHRQVFPVPYLTQYFDRPA
jgi:hypothetical protein